MSETLPPLYVEYLRVSGASQLTRDTISHQAQALDRLRVDRTGECLGRVQEREAVSGALLLSDREGGRELMRLLQSGAPRARAEGRRLEIRAFELSRITRANDKAEIGRLFQAATDYDALWVDARGTVIDTRDDHGFMIWVFLCAHSAKERALTRTRTMSGRKRNLTDDKPANAGLPYGIEWRPNDPTAEKGWYFDEAKLAPVIRAFQLSLSVGRDRVCRTLLLEGHAPPEGGATWSNGTIGGWLANEAYMGDLRQRIGDMEKVIHLPRAVISREEFDAVQEGMHHRKKQRRRDFYSIDWLCRGLVFCSTCGRVMTLQNRTNDVRRYFLVRCRHPDCENRSTYSAEVLDAEVWDLLRRAVEDTSLLRRAASMSGAGPDWESRIDDLTAKVSGNEKEQMSMMRFRASPGTTAMADARITELGREHQLLSADLVEAKKGVEQRRSLERSLSAAQDGILALRKHLDSADFGTRRRVVETLLKPAGRISLGQRRFDGSAAFVISGTLLALSRGPDGAMLSAPTSRCTRGSTPDTG